MTSEAEKSTMIDGDDLDPKHSYPCPVCWTKRAIYNTDLGLYQPCLGCQKKGFIIIKSNPESH